MMRIRLLMIGAFCWIAVLIAAGRSDQFPLVGTINAAFYVYLLAAATMAVIIAYPEYAQKPIQSTLVAVLGIYGLFKALHSTGQIIDATFIYLAVAEVVILWITLYVARHVSASIANVEKAVHHSLLPSDAFSVMNEDEGEKVISEEILRARRYERPLTLIHITIPRLHKKRLSRLSQKRLLEQEYVQLRIIQIIRNLIYDSDYIAWHNDNLVVCLPETGEEEADVLAFPLEALLTSSLREEVKVSMACFPQDALVYKDLLSAAISASRTVREPVFGTAPAAVPVHVTAAQPVTTVPEAVVDSEEVETIEAERIFMPAEELETVEAELTFVPARVKKDERALAELFVTPQSA